MCEHYEHYWLLSVVRILTQISTTITCCHQLRIAFVLLPVLALGPIHLATAERFDGIGRTLPKELLPRCSRMYASPSSSRSRPRCISVGRRAAAHWAHQRRRTSAASVCRQSSVARPLSSPSVSGAGSVDCVKLSEHGEKTDEND